MEIEGEDNAYCTFDVMTRRIQRRIGDDTIPLNTPIFWHTKIYYPKDNGNKLFTVFLCVPCVLLQKSIKAYGKLQTFNQNPDTTKLWNRILTDYRKPNQRKIKNLSAVGDDQVQRKYEFNEEGMEISTPRLDLWMVYQCNEWKICQNILFQKKSVFSL